MIGRKVPLIFGVVAAWVVFPSLPSSASTVRYRAFDQISQSYEIPVTNPFDHATWPSVLLVGSATLDTRNPEGSGVVAPTGMIYLSLQASSSPVQLPLSNPDSGNFFSNITPLPAAAVSYVASSGRHYPATRVNPVDQTNSPGPADGLIDATYYFTVPLSNRRGTIVISPCRSIGVEYQNFVGGSPLPLTIGGPTRIPVSFPAQLTVTTTPLPPSSGSQSAVATPASALNGLTTLAASLIVLFTIVRARKRKRRVAVEPITGTTPPSPEQRPNTTSRQPDTTPPQSPDAVVSQVAPTSVKVADPESIEPHTTLRVDVLGPLAISPTFASPSDPVRAIIAYLAINSDRAHSLDEIQTAVWPFTERGTDIKRPAMRNYMTDARKVVGDQHLPTASGRPGYQLVDFDTDWAYFQRLLAQAGSRSSNARGLRLEALRLIRGVPFSADTSRYFNWTFTTSVVYKMVEAVTDIAHGLSRDLVLAGDLAGAESVLRQGLLVDEASLTLWQDLTDVILESADQSLLDLHWRMASAVLRPEDVVTLRERVNG
jgi:DNA-binding SARP family transcriptional activator